MQQSAVPCQVNGRTYFVPSLVLDKEFGAEGRTDSQLMSDIRRVFQLHRGPLKHFSYSLLFTLHDNTDQTLQLLPRKQTIESLTLEYCYGIDMSRLSPFSKLQTLSLHSCRIASSSAVLFELFNNLTVLDLRSVAFQLQELRFRFPSLATLILDSCYLSLPRAWILIEEAPKLSRLYLDGNMSPIRFNCSTPLLRQVTIRVAGHLSARQSNLLKANGVLTTVESLTVGGCFYQYLAAEEAQYIEGNNNDEKPWKKLKHMRVEGLDMSRTSHACGVLRMIDSSPNLQHLAIIMMDCVYRCWLDTKSSDDMKALEMMKSEVDPSKLGQPKRIEMEKVRGTDDELTLISWLLKSTPALEEMKIRFPTTYELFHGEKSMVVNSVDRFQRASRTAQILII